MEHKYKILNINVSQPTEGSFREKHPWPIVEGQDPLELLLRTNLGQQPMVKSCLLTETHQFITNHVHI